MAFLTDRTLATGVTFNDLIHIVITGDTSQNPAGSSYKATIGQVTNLVQSVVITGGTYDPNTGIITFTNSSGGTFTVSGFVSGFTDTYVSGGTYTAGTATFTNTTGGTFTVTGFTEPFSGGSGNCITDFYVTNIYGCSPITLKSESQFDGNTATGLLSFAHGLLTTSSGDYSHSEGLLTIASGNYSHSEGRSSSATTLYAHSEGTSTIASGGGSHAEGNRTQSIGDNSHSEGSGTTATGDYSHAEGFATTSSGISSHSEGSGTTASGNYSHSEGSGNQSIGIASHTEGLGNIAIGNYQHVQGQYNLTATTSSAFIIGNGKTSIDRSNLVLAVDNSFNIYGNLNVSGSINLSGSSEYISTTGFTTSAITLTGKTLTYNGISYLGNVDVTIPSSSGVTGLKIIIKDEGGYAGSYRIRITPITGLIDGNNYVDMNINYMSLTLVARNNNWWII